MSSLPVLNSQPIGQDFPWSPKTPKSELSLEYFKRDGKTVLTHSRFSHPWYAFHPLYLDNTGCATTYLTNPSGGFVGGDDLSLVAKLQAHTHVLFTTPNATKIYRTLSRPASQSIDITVGPHAIVEWVPELTIPFSESRFNQSIHVRLDKGASVLLWDALAAGRVARGERWAFSHYANQITISLKNGKSLQERYVLSPALDNPCLVFNQGWNYVGSFFIVSDHVSSLTWERTKEELTTVFPKNPKHVIGGISEPSVPGLIAKVMTHSASELNEVFEKIWAVVRQNMLGTALPALRRY